MQAWRGRSRSQGGGGPAGAAAGRGDRRARDVCREAATGAAAMEMC